MRLIDNTAKYLKRTEYRINRGIKKSAGLVKKTARQIVPVDTGKLQKSIRYKMIKGRTAAMVGSARKYARHVEFGTSDTPAMPYLRRAMAMNMRKIRKLLTGKYYATREGDVKKFFGKYK